MPRVPRGLAQVPPAELCLVLNHACVSFCKMSRELNEVNIIIFIEVLKHRNTGFSWSAVGWGAACLQCHEMAFQGPGVQTAEHVCGLLSPTEVTPEWDAGTSHLSG